MSNSTIIIEVLVVKLCFINLDIVFVYVGGPLLLLAYQEERTMKSRTTGTLTLEKGF